MRGTRNWGLQVQMFRRSLFLSLSLQSLHSPGWPWPSYVTRITFKFWFFPSCHPRAGIMVKCQHSLHAKDHAPGSVHARSALYQLSYTLSPKTQIPMLYFHAQILPSYWGLGRHGVCEDRLVYGKASELFKPMHSSSQCRTMRLRGERGHAQGHMTSWCKQVKMQVSGHVAKSSYCAEVVS